MAIQTNQMPAENGTFQRYLKEIGEYSLLTRESEKALAREVIDRGDEEAAHALIVSNLRLVVKIALDFQKLWHQNLLDLIQEGNIGLIHAAYKFDPGRNVKFSYYASFWIKAYISKFIMSNYRLVKIGTTQGQRKLFYRLKKEKQKLTDQGLEPDPLLLSRKLDASVSEIIEVDQRMGRKDMSLDAPVRDESDTETIEIFQTEAESVEERVAEKEMEMLLHRKLSEFRTQMTPRELDIFNRRIYTDAPATLRTLGEDHGISRERVRQVEKGLIQRVKKFLVKEISDLNLHLESAKPDCSNAPPYMRVA